MNVVTRRQARSGAMPLKRYFTGVPCKHGHVCERMTSDRSCLMCHSAKTKAQIIRRRDDYNAMRRTSNALRRDEVAAQSRTYRSLKRQEKINDEPI